MIGSSFLQGKENLVGRAMTEVQSEFATFRNRNAACNEKVAFAVIAGDFNIDNISPGKKRELLSESSDAVLPDLAICRHLGYFWGYFLK